LLNLAAELGNVSRACKVMGFSRDTFYRYQSAVESGGVEALIDYESAHERDEYRAAHKPAEFL
ncbi:helix-turn-helix domain-containing protein, partial [Undibacterium sp. JH2W]|uniref:helix-turn-helix domain-containing protein n=1 Tax=Undibacterium sp. JH2W TaxID=3413037 RepID=UPI003BF0F890